MHASCWICSSSQPLQTSLIDNTARLAFFGLDEVRRHSHVRLVSMSGLDEFIVHMPRSVTRTSGLGEFITADAFMMYLSSRSGLIADAACCLFDEIVILFLPTRHRVPA